MTGRVRAGGTGFCLHGLCTANAAATGDREIAGPDRGSTSMQDTSIRTRT